MKVRLHVVGGPGAGPLVEIDGRNNVIVGRAEDANLRIERDPALSKHHFLLELDPPRMHVRDLGSRHGTFVNGSRVDEAELHSGDDVRAGDSVVRVELSASASSGTRLGRASAEVAAVAPVRCRCGAPAPNEPARATDDDVVYLCARCQEDLIAHPVLPPGYRVVRVLGRGAMGCVYLARHDELGVERAIKQILPRAAMTAQARARFLREATVQAALVHPRIVRVYELGEPTPGGFNLVMEYVDGDSADKLLARGPLEPGLAVAIACQALEGLAHAHAHDIVHRDIKEGNLLVARDTSALVVKVADFGLAKNYQESGASGFTGDGDLGGTLPYMPREQLIDFRYVEPPADIYAMGATLYRLLTGAFPRDYRDGENWVLVTLERPIVPLHQRAPALPLRLAIAVDKALAVEPRQRYRDAAEMRAALAASLS